MENEIRDLRLWRHDLEGMGIMGIPERVRDLEEARHQEALKNVEFRLTVQALKEGMNELSTTIKEFHGDLAVLRKLFIACIGLITLSILLPPELVTKLVELVLKVL
jgi:hypothetical protein